MCLIQEALRRKDDDEGGAKLTPPPRMIPPAYDVPPVLKIPEKRKSEGKSWTVLIVSLVFILALILAALGLLVYSTRQIVRTAVVVSPPAQPGEIPGPVAPASVVTPAGRPVIELEAVPAPPVAEERPEPPAVPAPRPPPAAPPVRQPVITEIPRKTLEGVRTVPAAVTGTSAWPRLNLHGIMAQPSPGQGSAIINGTVVEVGERIDGARLVEVQRNGVLLEYKGNTQFVRVGQSTF